MDAATLDYGAYNAFLRQFGPPESVPLADFAGNADASEKASGFWELVEAVSALVVTDNSAADRVARLSWFAGDAVPFAQVVAAYAVTANHTSRVTFAVGTQWTGAQNAPTIVTPMPGLMILPGWTLTLDVLAGVAGDAVSDVRIYRRRFRAIELEPE